MSEFIYLYEEMKLRDLKQRISVQLRIEGLRGVEIEQRKIVGEEFICEPEKGPILG